MTSVVTSTPPTPGESAHYALTVRGLDEGHGHAHHDHAGHGVLGRTIVKTTITIE